MSLKVSLPALAAALSLCSPQLGEAAEQKTTLTRKGKWEIIEGSTCDLIGTFGDNQSAAKLIFTKHGPWDYFDLTFAPTDAPMLRRGIHATIDFGPVRNPRGVEWTAVALDGKIAVQFAGQRIDDTKLRGDEAAPDITSEQEADVDRVDLSLGDSHFQLIFGSLGPAFNALNRCVDRMIASWGYDPAQQAALHKPLQVANYPGAWVTTADYPTAARRERLTGTVWFRLSIDQLGKVIGCHIQTSTAAPILQTKTCSLVTSRARFRPAEDTDGKPVPTYYVNKVRWALP